MKTITIFNFNELKEDVQKKVVSDLQFNVTNEYLEQEFEKDMIEDHIKCVLELSFFDNWRDYILDYEIIHYERGYESYYTIDNIIWNNSVTEEIQKKFTSRIKSNIKSDLEKMYKYAYSEECVIDYLYNYDVMFTRTGQAIYNY